jgi:UDP-glucose 4-epimerase
MSPVSLVTGGAGFIGSHVADSLLAMGHRVVVLDDLSGGFRENVPAKALFVQGTVTDSGLVDRLFAEHRFDHVYHLAAYAAEGLSHFIRRFNYTNNVIGSMTLINASVNHGVTCFVFSSSIAVYGPGQTPMREDMTPEPEDPYGIAKYAVELDLKAAKRMFGLDYVIFRPHNVYGEQQNTADRYRNVLGIFMNQILQGKPCTVFGDGEQTRAFTHISDIAPVIARSVDVPAARNQVFNIGADRPYTVNRLVEVVQAAMGRKTGVVHLDARQEVVHAFSDHGKVARVFGQAPGVSLEDGVARMAAWVKSVGARQPTVFEGIEVEKNLPPAWRATQQGGSL